MRWASCNVLLGFKTEARGPLVFPHDVRLVRVTEEVAREAKASWGNLFDWCPSHTGRWYLRADADEPGEASARDASEHKLQRFAACMLCVIDGNYGRHAIIGGPVEDPSAFPSRLGHAPEERLKQVREPGPAVWSEEQLRRLEAIWVEVWPYVRRRVALPGDTKNDRRVPRSLNAYWASFRIDQWLPTVRLPVAVSAIEALIGTGGVKSGRDFSFRLASLLGTDELSREALCRKTVFVYAMRSAFVHGARYSQFQEEQVHDAVETATNWYRELLWGGDLRFGHFALMS